MRRIVISPSTFIVAPPFGDVNVTYRSRLVSHVIARIAGTLKAASDRDRPPRAKRSRVQIPQLSVVV